MIQLKSVIIKLFQGTSSRPINISANFKANNKKNRTKPNLSKERIYIVEMEAGANKTRENRKTRRITPETIDKISSVIYILFFVLFNVYYWSFFLTEADKQ